MTYKRFEGLGTLEKDISSHLVATPMLPVTVIESIPSLITILSTLIWFTVSYCFPFFSFFSPCFQVFACIPHLFCSCFQVSISLVIPLSPPSLSSVSVSPSLYPSLSFTPSLSGAWSEDWQRGNPDWLKPSRWVLLFFLFFFTSHPFTFCSSISPPWMPATLSLSSPSHPCPSSPHPVQLIVPDPALASWIKVHTYSP